MGQSSAIKNGQNQILLSKFPEIEVIGEADSVANAVGMISESSPDLVFLDIQMPEESGFKLFDRVEKIDFKIIFVTAFDNYAIRAFEVNALDYLLKPVNPSRLAQSIARLSEQKSRKETSSTELKYDDYVFIKSQGRTGFVKLSSIVCIKSIGDYTEIHTTSGVKRLAMRSLREWEESLPSQYFLRIHRTVIINIEYVESVEPGLKCTFQVCLRNIPDPFTTSRKYSQELKKRFF
jgi:two-component system, LytTR family, response regulator